MQPGNTNLKTAIIAFGATLFVCAIGVGQAQNIITNGSFEQPVTGWYLTMPSLDLPGWTVTEVSVDVVSGNGYFGADAADGAQLLDLDGSPGPGQITQPFNTVPGALYQLSFAYANNYVQQPSASALVRVFDATGDRLGPDTVIHATSAHGSLDWRFYSKTFTAGKTITTLEFTSLSASNIYGGILLDAVAVIGPLTAPDLTIHRSPGDSQLELCWNSVSNISYDLQYSSNLTSNIWLPLTNCVQGNGVTNCAYDAIQFGQPQKFYRIVVTNCAP